MRDAFRSGDIWLAHSRRYGDVKQALVSIEATHTTARLAVPYESQEWLGEHKAHLGEGLDRLADAAQHGRIPGGAIENGELRIVRLASAMPEDVDELVLDLYRRLPEVRITDVLLEVDAATGFTDAFTHLPHWRAVQRTASDCSTSLLAEGLNLGISKMAEASNTHDFFQLSPSLPLAYRKRGDQPGPGHGDRGAGATAHEPASGARGLPPPATASSSRPRARAKP